MPNAECRPQPAPRGEGRRCAANWRIDGGIAVADGPIDSAGAATLKSELRCDEPTAQVQAERIDTDSYVNIAGYDHQIDYNELRNKSTLGNMLDITGSGSQVARRLWVHHNYFPDFTSPGGNGAGGDGGPAGLHHASHGAPDELRAQTLQHAESHPVPDLPDRGDGGPDRLRRAARVGGSHGRGTGGGGAAVLRPEVPGASDELWSTVLHHTRHGDPHLVRRRRNGRRPDLPDGGDG